MRDYFRHLFAYRRQSGMVAWMLMRLSGIGLFFFVCLHLSVVYCCVRNQPVFSYVLGLEGHWAVKILESLLILGLSYHATNGLRIILLETGLKQERIPFILAVGVSLVLTALFWQAVRP